MAPDRASRSVTKAVTTRAPWARLFRAVLVAGCAGGAVLAMVHHTTNLTGSIRVSGPVGAGGAVAILAARSLPRRYLILPLALCCIGVAASYRWITAENTRDLLSGAFVVHGLGEYLARRLPARSRSRSPLLAWQADALFVSSACCGLAAFAWPVPWRAVLGVTAGALLVAGHLIDHRIVR